MKGDVLKMVIKRVKQTFTGVDARACFFCCFCRNKYSVETLQLNF